MVESRMAVLPLHKEAAVTASCFSLTPGLLADTDLIFTTRRHFAEQLVEEGMFNADDVFSNIPSVSKISVSCTYLTAAVALAGADSTAAKYSPAICSSANSGLRSSGSVGRPQLGTSWVLPSKLLRHSGMDSSERTGVGF